MCIILCVSIAVLLQPQPLYYCVPGVVIGIAILLVLQRYHHFLVLPGLLLAIPVAFYLITAALGFTLEDWCATCALAPHPLASSLDPVLQRSRHGRRSGLPATMARAGLYVRRI